MNMPWSCYLDAVVRVTGVHEEHLISLIGHNGSEIVTELPAPFCYRGFNPHAVGMAMMNLGWLLATYPGKVEEYTVMGKAPHTSNIVTGLRNRLIEVARPVVYCGEDHAIGYLVSELGSLPLQVPEYFTICHPLT